MMATNFRVFGCIFSSSSSPSCFALVSCVVLLLFLSSLCWLAGNFFHFVHAASCRLFAQVSKINVDEYKVNHVYKENGVVCACACSRPIPLQPVTRSLS